MLLSGIIWEASDPTLTINGDRIPTAEDGEFKFLGMPVRVCSSNEEARSSLQETLRKMLSATDATPLTRHQKIRLYKHGVCPRFSWPLLVETFPTSWPERVLQPMATNALKSLAGLARHSNSSVLFLSVKRGVWPCLLCLGFTGSCKHKK